MASTLYVPSTSSFDTVELDLLPVMQLATFIRSGEDSAEAGIVIVDTPRAANPKVVAEDFKATPPRLMRSAWMAEPLGIDLGLEVVDKMPNWHNAFMTAIITAPDWTFKFVFQPSSRPDVAVFGARMAIMHAVVFGDVRAFENDLALLKFVVPDLDEQTRKWSDSWLDKGGHKVCIPVYDRAVPYFDAVKSSYGLSNRNRYYFD
jgi:hypothetical protein